MRLHTNNNWTLYWSWTAAFISYWSSVVILLASLVSSPSKVKSSIFCVLVCSCFLFYLRTLIEERFGYRNHQNSSSSKDSNISNEQNQSTISKDAPLYRMQYINPKDGKGNERSLRSPTELTSLRSAVSPTRATGSATNLRLSQIETSDGRNSTMSLLPNHYITHTTSLALTPRPSQSHRTESILLRLYSKQVHPMQQ